MLACAEGSPEPDGPALAVVEDVVEPELVAPDWPPLGVTDEFAASLLLVPVWAVAVPEPAWTLPVAADELVAPEVAVPV